METALLISFWYGILHALAPDHLCVIANFSLGKSKQKTLVLTLLFALGHGLILYFLAQLLLLLIISSETLEHLSYYADLYTGLVIICFGLYLVFMVFSDKIHLKKHNHQQQQHIHIWLGKKHYHQSKKPVDFFASFSFGTLMGVGGIKTLLVSLTLVSTQEINLSLVLFFALGVMVVFIGFGLIILYINQNLLKNKQDCQIAFGSVGLSSIIIGSMMLV